MVDMEEMIKEEISRIGVLEERVLFKDMIEQVFLSLYEANREMYRALESRVMDDLAYDINRYRVCTAIVEREYVDRSHHLLSPMREEDLEETGYDAARLSEELGREGCAYARTMFLACDYLRIRELLAKERVRGRVLTEAGEYPAEFLLKPNRAYLEEVARLYRIFVSNGIGWQTVNAPYLHKFIDVYLVAGGLPFPTRERVLGMEPELQELGACAYGNYVPLWNIRKLSLNSVGFPIPCEDHRSFEHIISIRGYGEGHVYLIDDEEGIHHVRQMGTRLSVLGKEAEARKWKVYMVRSGENRKFERFSHPVMTNQRNDEFVERFRRRQGALVRTAGELARFIRGFGMEEYVQFEGYEIRDRADMGISESYSMNGFILDEIREKEYKKCLLLTFRGKGKLGFLLRDIISFLVSEVQILYPEYQCEGRLV